MHIYHLNSGYLMGHDYAIWFYVHIFLFVYSKLRNG
jgi:hypothetical protein